eukprot:g954.t1
MASSGAQADPAVRGAALCLMPRRKMSDQQRALDANPRGHDVCVQPLRKRFPGGRRPSNDLAQYFQAKREAAREEAPPVEQDVPHFGLEFTDTKESTVRAALEELEAELKALKLTELKVLAEAYKCEAKAIDRAYDRDNPNVAMKDLIIETWLLWRREGQEGDKAKELAKELGPLKPSDWRRRAEAEGIGPRRIGQAENEENPKVALLKLLLRPEKRRPPTPERKAEQDRAEGGFEGHMIHHRSDAPKKEALVVDDEQDTPETKPVASPKFAHMTLLPSEVEEAAATRIQATLRGSAARRRSAVLREKIGAEEDAAITIQRNIRRHQARLSIEVERDEIAKAAVVSRSKLQEAQQLALENLKADMQDFKAKDLRRLAEDESMLERARQTTTQLQELTVPDLKKKAKAAGFSVQKVEQAEDGDEPKVALFKLLSSDLLKLQHADFTLDTSPAFEVPELAHAFLNLRAALEAQRPKQLAKILRSAGCRAEELQEAEDDERNGVSAVELEDCEDTEAPKVALMKLLFSRMPFHPSQQSSTQVRRLNAGSEVFSFNMDLNQSMETLIQEGRASR